jgi:hypothetical protein
LVFAENSNSSSMIVFPDGTCEPTVLPQGAFDLRLPVPQEATSRLSEEWAGLQRHHASIPGAKRSFQAAQVELGRRLPFDKDPVLGI